MTKTNKIVKIGVNVLVTILVLFALLFAIAGITAKTKHRIPNFFGTGLLAVESNSMNAEGGFKKGDFIYLDFYNYTEEGEVLKVGDVITFETRIEDKVVLNTHRIVEVHEDTMSYTTKGDANPTNDEQQVSFFDVYGVWTGERTAGAGGIYLFLKSPAGFLIFIVLPLIALFTFEIFNFKKAYVEYKNSKKSKDDIEAEIERLKAQLNEKK